MFRFVAAAAALSLSVAALAESAPAAEATAVVAVPSEIKKEQPFPLKASVSLTQQLGSATFVTTDAVESYNPTFSTALTLAPSATLAKDWTLSLQQIIGIEWTRSDSTTYANQLELSDLSARISWSAFKWEDLGLSLGINAGYNLPLSMPSRQQGSTGAMSLGSRLGYAHKPSGFSAYGALGLGVNPTFEALKARFANVDAKPYNDRALGLITPVACNPRPGEAGGVCTDGLFPSGLSWRGSLGLGYSPSFLDDKLSFSLDLGYAQGFSSFTVWERDELTADNAGVGLIPRQSTQGNLSASYQVADWFVATLGAQSGQPFLNARGDGIRFPLWDFTSTANNFSSIYVDTNFSF